MQGKPSRVKLTKTIIREIKSKYIPFHCTIEMLAKTYNISMSAVRRVLLTNMDVGDERSSGSDGILEDRRLKYDRRIEGDGMKKHMIN